jgi:sulfite exporter TauE/SafE
MAVVGGLVLSISANFAKKGENIKPQILFHLGRLASFFILGGVIGAIGSSFQFGKEGIFILGLIVAVILLILGFNLLDVFPWTKKYNRRCRLFCQNAFTDLAISDIRSCHLLLA